MLNKEAIEGIIMKQSYGCMSFFFYTRALSIFYLLAAVPLPMPYMPVVTIKGACGHLVSNFSMKRTNSVSRRIFNIVRLIIRLQHRYYGLGLVVGGGRQ